MHTLSDATTAVGRSPFRPTDHPTVAHPTVVPSAGGFDRRLTPLRADPESGSQAVEYGVIAAAGAGIIGLLFTALRPLLRPLVAAILEAVERLVLQWLGA